MQKGKFINYMAYDEEEEAQRLKSQSEICKLSEEKKKQWELKKQQAEEKSFAQNAQIIEEKKKRVVEDLEKVISIKAFPIRQYLIESLSPLLSDAFFKIIKDSPKDPLEFLVKM